MPSKGSIGQADITILGHTALAMIGEGEVTYQGKRLPARDAFAQADIKIIEPYGKDALAILSTNAYSLGLAALQSEKLAQIDRMQHLVYALSLEGLNGNVSPILADNVAAKGFPYGIQSAKTVRDHLAGSYLWQRDDNRAVQDPLSFRDGVWILSAFSESAPACRRQTRHPAQPRRRQPDRRRRRPRPGRPPGNPAPLRRRRRRPLLLRQLRPDPVAARLRKRDRGACPQRQRLPCSASSN